MKKVPLFLATTLLLLAIAGCVTIKVDEASAFAPPKRELGPATTQNELDARMAERLQRGGATSGLILNTERNGETRISFGPEWGPNIANRALLAPLTYSNRFVGEGTERIATTLYSRTATTEAFQPSLRPLVVHCAGNAGDRYNSGLSYATKVLPWADVLVFDYPGYGDTPGSASAAAFEASSKAITDHVMEIAANRKVVFWGHSLGGFVCARLAASMPDAAGMILETTAPNAAAVARAWTPSYTRLFVRTSVAPSLASYDVVADAARVKGPVLVLGATKDTVLPVTLARQISDGLKTRGANVMYQEYPDANHWAVRYQAGFTETMSRFFSAVDAQR